MKRKLKRWITELNVVQLDLLHQLLLGEMLLINIHSEPYAAKRDGLGYWRLVKLHEMVAYRTNKESCTCQDSKFRARICKHVETVQKCLK